MTDKKDIKTENVKFSIDIPCWHCGKQYIGCVRKYDRKTLGKDRSDYIISCPDCGKIYEFGNFPQNEVEDRLIKMVREVPRDPERRAKYYAKHRFIDQCRLHRKEEDIWSFEGENTCYGADFYIKPTKCDDGKTIYIGCSYDEYGGFLTPENARALRDALNKWLGEE